MSDALIYSAMAVAYFDLVLIIVIFIWIRKVSFKTLSEFSDRQRAAYTLLRQQLKNDSATDAIAIMRMQADVDLLKDKIIISDDSTNRKGINLLVDILHNNGLTMVANKWRSEMQSKGK